MTASDNGGGHIEIYLLTTSRPPYAISILVYEHRVDVEGPDIEPASTCLLGTVYPCEVQHHIMESCGPLCGGIEHDGVVIEVAYIPRPIPQIFPHCTVCDLD